MQSRRISHLDFVRGLAALAVCAGHLRAFQFVTLEQAHQVSLPDKAFYFFTGCGHQAVMVFFVLSGYFVGGSVADSIARSRWSWGGYALRRLTRLWLVLIPALLLTLLWDELGRHLTRGAGYNGDFAGIIHSGPAIGVPISIGWLDFLGNLAFLQTITSPVFGTNGPLWSLASEFWYYALFPLGFLVLHPNTRFGRRIILGILFSLTAWMLPGGVLLGFITWLLGYTVHASTKHPRLQAILGSLAFFSVSCLVFIGALLAARLGRAPAAVADLAVGLGVAGMLPFLIQRQPREGLYVRISTGLSEMSYTLYVVHFPVLAFVFFSFRLPAKSQPDATAYLVFIGLLVAVVAYAALVWWVFEKRTDMVRAKVADLLSAFTGASSKPKRETFRNCPSSVVMPEKLTKVK